MSRPTSALARPRLLIIAPAAYPLGGVATWLDSLSAGLRERGWPLEVALLSGSHHDVDRYLDRHSLGAIRRVDSASGSREGRQRALVKLLEASRAELVLSVNVGDIEDAVDRFRRERRGALRLVTAQHGLQRDFYDHLAARARIVDGAIMANRLGCELARVHSGLPAERIAYAPCGVDVDAQSQQRKVDGALAILWAGRLEQVQKRVADLPAICAGLADAKIEFRLTVAGSGPEEVKLAAALAPFERDGSVRRLGELSAARMRDEAYADADLLLITSSWETGPIVAWEAFASGLAVVSSRFLGSGREGALRHEQTALLYPIGDVPAAVTQLARARDRALRDRLAAAGRAEVRARYSVAASVEAWEAALLGFVTLPPRVAREAGEPIPAGGRLDRWIGPGAAETVRSMMGVRHRQGSPSAEWPHALVGGGDDEEFLRLSATLDHPPNSVSELTG